MQAMKKDFIDTLKVSKKITHKDVTNVRLITKVMRAVVNMFSPLF